VLYALLQRVREFHFQTPQEGAPSALVGRYVRRGKSSDYLELASDGTFHLLQGGKHYEGNYRIQPIPSLSKQELSGLTSIGSSAAR